MTNEKILTKNIKINPDFNYGETDDDVFRSLWFLFDPPPARKIVLKAMDEYADQFAAEFAEWCGRNYERYATGWIERGRLNIPRALENKDIKTTSELIQIFKQSKQK